MTAAGPEMLFFRPEMQGKRIVTTKDLCYVYVMTDAYINDREGFAVTENIKKFLE